MGDVLHLSVEVGELGRCDVLGVIAVELATLVATFLHVRAVWGVRGVRFSAMLAGHSEGAVPIMLRLEAISTERGGVTLKIGMIE